MQAQSQSALTRTSFSMMVCAILACGGSDEASPSPETEIQASGGGTGAAADGSELGNPGQATVSVGDTDYQFEIRCYLGKYSLYGPGQREDGTPAYLSSFFDADAPNDAYLSLFVGTDQPGGEATEEWVAGITHSTSEGLSWQESGSTLSASGPFLDDRARSRGESAPEVDGALDAECEEG